jgi:hypothetical protein
VDPALRPAHPGDVSCRALTLLGGLCTVCWLLAADVAVAETELPPPSEQLETDAAPEANGEEPAPGKTENDNRDFLIVPIPLSDPTLGTGLVLGAAYFYPQTPAQAEAQPASVTGVAGMATSTNSRALGVLQRNYWGEDTWRFAGGLGVADLRLPLLPPETAGSDRLDWRVEGVLASAKLMRRIRGDWYAGANMRWIQADQSIQGVDEADGFSLGNLTSAGIGFNLEYDSRDVPMNPYSGQHLTVATLFNDEALGSDSTYQSYKVAWRSYHSLSDAMVLAWELQGCQIGGTPPLWDSCIVPLRGFPATEYLGKSTVSGQVELRWRFGGRWGLVGFTGVGFVEDSLAGESDGQPIESYGAGLRFMVLKDKRINLRLDYGRSRNDDAVYFGVVEAF